jgi:hypothetical protein
MRNKTRGSFDMSCVLGDRHSVGEIWFGAVKKAMHIDMDVGYLQ